MYTAISDPYCYQDTDILINIPGIINEEILREFEAAITTQRADEGFPTGDFDITHYKSIHYHLFQDIYSWAGEYRTIRISKNTSSFCYPENIPDQMGRLFQLLNTNNRLQNLNAETFSNKLTDFLSNLNAIHPFREGNGRIQNIFITLLSEQAGHPIDFNKIDVKNLLDVMIKGFNGDNLPLEQLIFKSLTK
ncbi:adenosine monophosphate-protein transferase [Candidatus Kaiserbacteria bacterium RIFOXYD1_FULL_42_15]|uniref:protein adenylyltransferase n=1 Tax=Candidatus Kaiserbacteria bacterium RIFOXYD1_FULL_42_15 TaxID=1798532 RepID=A0A1F6FTS4_9BACT|nr:MAG: adenosine monophosphate-protein transferase [Candidatus Kaiserbacteria bacterium RIFOXYD1_FULL_42_15]